ncbi:MAG TPA: hypothetical protein PLO36_01635 [Methanofastidiosum sp.]|nr:hypothetical protein [Methanofastidiosum sp.]HPA48817.1 hypothetical protein [Methanofastidiosum sp.]HQM94276.1 hypothetical protein [Methanofastidiosum sp.]HQQ48760.1 hypothetical protein [Methanofastidiosum sp.]
MRKMKIKPSLVIGVIVAVIGFLIMSSYIFGIKLDFLPIENGIFPLGIIIMVIGIIIAAKIPNEEY